MGDEPGITRDRIHGIAEHDGRRFELIDTGGIVVNDPITSPRRSCSRPKWLWKTASHIIFLVDGRGEITGSDRDLARMLQRLGKPVSLAVNKADTGSAKIWRTSSIRSGIPDIFPVSAEHGHRHRRAARPRHRPLSSSEEPVDEEPVEASIKIAIIGRPNVGKSTLLNALTGQERAIVSPIAGTTRDAVDETVMRDGTNFVFVDTAGIRRKGKTTEMAEKLSVVMARRNIRMAHVVLLVLDATEGVVGARRDHRRLRARRRPRGDCVRQQVRPVAGSQEAGIRGADQRRVQVSGLRAGAFPLGQDRRRGGKAVPADSRSVRFGLPAHHHRRTEPLCGALRFEERKIFYITQASIRPPAFVVFTDKRRPAAFLARAPSVNQIRRPLRFPRHADFAENPPRAQHRG